MVERFAQYLSTILIRSGTANQDQHEYLTYGLFCLLSGSLQIGLLFIISLHLKIMLQAALFTIGFGILKRTIGGWHAKRHITCLAGYTSVAVISVLIGDYLPLSCVLPIIVSTEIIMAVIIWIKAPVEHPNNPQTAEYLAVLKQISRKIAAVHMLSTLVLSTTLRSYSCSRLLLYVALGGFTASFTLLIPNKRPLEKGGTSR